MPHRGIVWSDAAPDLRIDGDGAVLSFQSGEMEFVHRMSRASLRKLAECAIRRLDEADTAEIIQFKRRCG